MSFNPGEPLLLFASAVPVSLTGTLTKTSLRSFTLKANTMGLNDCLEVWSLWSHTNSVNNKLENVAFGSATIIGANTTTNDSMNRPNWVWNRNSLSSQLFYAAGQITGTGNTSSGAATTTQNTATDILIDFLGTLVDTGEVITLEACHVKLWRYLP